jgi:hypothetical protein
MFSASVAVISRESGSALDTQKPSTGIRLRSRSAASIRSRAAGSPAALSASMSERRRCGDRGREARRIPQL